ncbi:uncharacterized protein LOC120348790 isoform X2 [Nilaparvata lugens]|uniref:uncharacterized protein LOC120348790 isoform X2 n=1 Tax=Nilaparvata lugens TaxID=108931 RepID=UPI00193E1723|nr:uncharacterized protein LOC120348790 isoform X2 [Nilaparvata lugens]XP_039299963.1 uncharacterized protein LOC120348790 isoform X2 [Nilaparvata lugens]XP_039299965.1 uncharacterized protein LOC120348790 isoform X2 [Nilaparvata lugens]
MSIDYIFFFSGYSMKTSGIVGSSNISRTCETGISDVEDGVAHIHELIFSISIMDMSLATAGLDWARSVDAAMDQRSQAYQAGPATRPICGSRTEIFKQVRLECVVSLLKAAVAPLSSFIMEALALNHPLTAAIRQQLQLVPSKMVLKNINSMKPTTPFMRYDDV